MKPVEILIAAGCVVSFILGWNLHPDTKEINSDSSMSVEEFDSYCTGFYNGQHTTVNGFHYCEKQGVHPTKEISILTEQKLCKEKGGEFEVQGVWRAGIGLAYNESLVEKISCTKPYVNGNITGVETLFEYEIEN